MNLMELSAFSGIPYTTLRDWSKRENDWRKNLVEHLSEYFFLEDAAKKKILKLFKNNEIEAIYASFNGTIPMKDMFEIEQAFEMRIEDSVLYEPMVLMSYKPDDMELESFKNVLINKIGKLCRFEKYVLYKMAKEYWEKDL